MTTIIFIGLMVSTISETVAKCWLKQTINKYVQTSDPIETAKQTQKIYRLTAVMLGMPGSSNL